MPSFSFIIEGVLVPIVSILGLLGNVLSIIIFYNSHGDNSLHSNFTKLLICLAAFDSSILISANALVTMSSWSPESSLIIKATPYVLPLAGMFLTGSVYTVVAITVERYASIQKSHSRIFSARVLIFFIIVISVSYNFIKFFELKAVEVNYLERYGHVASNETYDLDDASNETFETYVQIEVTWLRHHPMYKLIYHMIIDLIVMTLFPIIVLTVMNIFILQLVKKITQKQSDTVMASLLFSIVLVLLVCHAPRIILNVIEVVFQEVQEIPEWVWTIMIPVSHLFLVINSSVNIIIYTAGDLKFRQALVKMFQCKRRSPTIKNISLESMVTEHTTDDIIPDYY